MNTPLLPVGKITADVFPTDAESYFLVSKEYDTTGVSVSNTMLYRMNPDYVFEDAISEERLRHISIGDAKLSRCYVMFDEGKVMADEILFLRAEVARLSSVEPQRNEDML